MEEWEEEGPSKLSKLDYVLKYGIYAVIAVAWFLFNGKLGIYTMDKTSAAAVILGLGMLAGTGVYDSMKNATPKFVYNDGWTTTDGEFKQIGNYAVHTPAIKAWGMYWKFRSPVHVMPIDAIRNKGRNLVGMPYFELVTIEELPQQARGFIIENGLRPPYYLGLADVEQYELAVKDPEKVSGIDNPSVGHLIQQTKELNKTVSMLQTILKEAYNVNEESLAAKMRMIERMQPSNIGAAVRRMFVDEKGEAAP